MRNGRHISRLTLGELPKALHRHTQNARTYRREVEALVCEAKGEVGLRDAHWVDVAATAEMHGAVCRWLLVQKLDKLSPSDILNCSKEIVRAKERRNAAFEKLGLDRTDGDLFDALYVDNTAADSDPPATPASRRQQPDPANDTDDQASTVQGEPETDED